MLDPKSTTVLMKRVVASLIDAATMSIPSLVILKATILSYAITTRNVNGDWVQSAAERAELDGLPLHFITRTQEIGDTTYVFGGWKFWLGLLLIILLPIIVYILVPAILEASLGKRLTNLQVVDCAGEPPSIKQYAIRTVVGIVDLPLIGLVAARLDTHHRRLGDRLAGTTVVDGANLSFVDADYWQQQQDALKRSAERSSTTDLDSMVAIDSRLHPVAPPAPPTAPPPAAPVEVPASKKAATPISVPTPDPDPVSSEPPTSTYVTESGFEVPEYATTPPEDRIPAAPLPEPEPEDFEPDFVPVPTLEPVQTQVSEPAWDEPTGSPAPVWSPGSPDDANPASDSAEIAPAEATIESPVWDDGWNSWMFFDPDQGRWLRHDTTANQWVIAE